MKKLCGMEDGSNGSSDVEVVDHTKNGLIQQIMAQNEQQENNIDDTKLIQNNECQIQVNGDNNSKNGDEEDYSSESDVLVIDESVPKKKTKNKKKSQKESDQTSEVTHSNPYFHESLFELSQQHHQQHHHSNTKPVKRPKTKTKPKLREYAQYLGLQPTVQFKCPKCGLAGFQSFNTLQEHVVQCTNHDQIDAQTQQSNSYTGNGFKLTRKVFLCSACGTYYENWNLYIHMLEYHHRYICLYCLGMFSILNDLYQHIQTKHNLKPTYRKTLDEFKNVYNEPCYVICCECNRMFNEQDNFYYHNCNNMKKKVKKHEKKLETLNNSSSEINTEINQTNEVSEVSEVKECVEDLTPPPPATNCDQNDIENVEENIVEEPEVENEPEPVVEEPVNVVEEPEKNDEPEETVVETRKVPKLSLKLPKFEPYVEHQDEDEDEDSDDSTKLTMEVEKQEAEEEQLEEPEPEPEEIVEEETPAPSEPQMQIAGPDVQIIDLELEQPLDKFDIRVLLQKCLKATAPLCIYCNHARKIAVNGRQLGLHAIAEHRFAGTVNSITAEELIPENFVNRIKDSLVELEPCYFNLESSINNDEAITFSHIFECFPCRYTTTIHKELYLHNRKMHTKNLLLCIMCKTTFYNYSELICHLCPGVYDSVQIDDIKFRCCMCISDDLPSAFRLMVHLRKKHHCCDVCLELCYNQYKLSNHVWKHKLHHFCYRCGIAYRNKPDITRHLFWKHGTESVMCKRCMQKKWPHVYHFCVPPTSFTCDECNLIFSKAIYLKVHKRIHSEEKKHQCTFEGCEEMFISKKLMLKHELKHHEPEIQPEEEKQADEQEEQNVETNADVVASEISIGNEEEIKVEEKIVKPKVDVYDLPELNLSESDSSDSETEMKMKQSPKPTNEEQVEKEEKVETEEDVQPVEMEPIANIWDNFKNYQANKEKLDHIFEKTSSIASPQAIIEDELTSEMALRDHDYFIDPESKHDTNIIEVKPDLTMQERVDHDYCSPKVDGSEKVSGEKVENEMKEKKVSSSDSSSDSDSSSCSCGSNCSCSSSSGSSSSSSDSSDSDSSTEEGRKRQKARRKQRQMNSKQKSKEAKSAVNPQSNGPIIVTDAPIRESDLETTESETDEEFYDKQPHKIARKLLEEKRNQLMAEVGPLNVPNGTFMESDSRPPTPPITYEENGEKVAKKKSKSKKRKKKKSERKSLNRQQHLDHSVNHESTVVYPTVAPITLTLKSSPLPEIHMSNNTGFKNSTDQMKLSGGEMSESGTPTTANLRASKRRRIPNKFYGYSSDEEQEKQLASPILKWRKVETPNSPKLVPPITIKTTPQPSPQPTVEPLSIRGLNSSGELRINRRPPPVPPPPQPSQPQVPPLRLPINLPIPSTDERDSDTPESDVEEEREEEEEEQPPVAMPSLPPRPLHPSSFLLNRPNHPPQTQLYCYCRCPYDEVSEMIGCDSSECAIEWFHFECVGIMVPPKGQWFCPDCRKKKQQRRSELLQQQQQQT